MLRELEILEGWQAGKLRRHFFRLTAEFVTAFEFRGPQFGHPSNYAGIKIVAAPASQFSLESAAVFPVSLPASYTEQLLLAVARGAVDELFAADWYPYRGCSVTVHEVMWDEFMSSEVAVYRATRGALSKLRQEGQWKLHEVNNDVGRSR